MSLYPWWIHAIYLILILFSLALGAYFFYSWYLWLKEGNDTDTVAACFIKFNS